MHHIRTCATRLHPLIAPQAARCPLLWGLAANPRPMRGERRYTAPIADEHFLNGSSSNYVEEMYYAWLENPKSVHKSWDIYFQNANSGAPPGTAYHTSSPMGMAHGQALVGAQPSMEKLVEDHLAVQSLIRAYQVTGHHIAKLDPLGISSNDAPGTVGFHRVDPWAPSYSVGPCGDYER